MSTREKLNALAESLLDAALAADSKMPTKERVEIFKPVSLWYLGVTKGKKGDPEDLVVSGTFDELRDKINGKEAMKQ